MPITTSLVPICNVLRFIGPPWMFRYPKYFVKSHNRVPTTNRNRRGYTMERTVTLGSKSGLHARPAAVFVQNAKGFQSQITLSKNEKTVNGKSILSILALGAEQGDQVILKIDGDDAQFAIDKLVPLLEGDLG